ncbi:GTP-binding protein [Nocardioides sp.]|uniref:GTP-binding protein n=1 Tax=Nocardioides sp. TaxID=35761 RepID=UPI003565BC1E
MRHPVVLVTGIDPLVTETFSVGLLWDLPGAVSVRHRIDPVAQSLTRVVSDAGGTVEQETVDLTDQCVSCAVRDDVLATLGRVAGEGRWRSVVAHLPVGVEARHVCAGVADDTRLARQLRITSVVTALDGARLEDDLLGDDLLRERDLHSGPGDARGAAETAAGMVEYADVVAVVGSADEPGVDLVRTLARPDAHVLCEGELLDPGLATSGRQHVHARTLAWVAPDRRVLLPQRRGDAAWTVDLRSERPFHPERLLENIADLGEGRHRSRGCFWLPTRPHTMSEWAGAGGQLSVGNAGPWLSGRPAMTRIVLTGTGAPPASLEPAFHRLLLSDAEIAARGVVWEADEDGLEPWLGPLRRIA